MEEATYATRDTQPSAYDTSMGFLACWRAAGMYFVAFFALSCSSVYNLLERMTTGVESPFFRACIRSVLAYGNNLFRCYGNTHLAAAFVEGYRRG